MTNPMTHPSPVLESYDYLTSPLKWLGGKRWLLSHLRELWKPGRRLVEPFVGGMSVALGLGPEQALVSDVNPHLMNFWRWVQAGLAWDDESSVEFINDRTIYYENRSKFNALCGAREHWTQDGALLFYYLNRTGFNGLCRFNKSGYFNVPFGSYKTINYKTNFKEFVPVLRNWEFYCGDFETLPLHSSDFIYSDPPYDVEFTQFASRDFVWADQERLARWLARHPGPVVASNQATDRICELYRSLGFEVLKIHGPRMISCTGDRTPALEILAIKR